MIRDLFKIDLLQTQAFQLQNLEPQTFQSLAFQPQRSEGVEKSMVEDFRVEMSFKTP